MNESFLHYLWKFRQFKNKNLETLSGQPVQIIRPGEHNVNAGPDFFNARLRIGDTTWAGNVEIHLKASDWIKHNHHNDQAYDNIILHVVYEADSDILFKNGSIIPVLQLKDYIDIQIWNRYDQLQKSQLWIPCQKHIKNIDSFTLDNWLDRLMIERLENKTAQILIYLEENKFNWEETFYQLLARNFGFRINSEPFFLLARSIPNSCLAKHKDKLFQVEAMLFGQAGMLEDNFTGEYPLALQKEYQYLKQKFGLIPIEKHLWKFLRLRPVNFPTIRIAQFCQLIHRSSHLFSKIMECEKVEELEEMFSASASFYWLNHFTFEKESSNQVKQIGKTAIHNIIINTIVPFLFVFGKQKHLESCCERALRLLSELSPENNGIIHKWEELGIKIKNAYRSQGLLQLKNEYCNQKKCLNCGVGKQILQPTNDTTDTHII